MLRTELEDGTLLETPEVIETAITDAAGSTGPIKARAGTNVRARIVSLPWRYLPLEYMDQLLSQPATVRLVNEHHVKWEVPAKPKVSVRVHDAASGERVHGVQYRIMVRPHVKPDEQARVTFGAETGYGVCEGLSAAEAAARADRDDGAPYEVRDAMKRAGLHTDEQPDPIFKALRFTGASRDGSGSDDAHAEDTHADKALGSAALGSVARGSTPIVSRAGGSVRTGRAAEVGQGGREWRGSSRSTSPLRPSKSLLKDMNKKEQKIKRAGDRWEEVDTWNGEFNDITKDAWGTIVYESWSGMDADVPLLVDVGMDVAVQVWRSWK